MEYLISLSLLILAVIGIRALFRRSASPKLIYALWLVVFVRLILPVQLFELEVPGAFVPTENKVNAEIIESEKLPYIDFENESNKNNELSFPIETSDVQNIPESSPVGKENNEKIPTSADDSNIPNGVISSTPGNVLSGATEIDKMPSAKKNISLSKLLKIIWLCGSVALALWYGLAALTFGASLRRERKKIGKYKNLKVYISAKVGTPCLYGIIPSVYLTPKAYMSEGRRMILRHEYIHLCHGDNIWSFFRICAVVFLWWNPLVWIAAYLSKQDGELACDYSVTGKMKENDRIEYARIIIDMLPVKRSIATGFASSSIKERVIMMTKKHKNKILSAILAIVIALAAASCSFVALKPGEDTVNKDNIETEKVPEGEVIRDIVIRILLNQDDFKVNYVNIPDSAQSVYHDYEGPDFASDKKLFRVDRTEEYGTFDLYLLDMNSGRIVSTLTVYSDIMPTNAMIKNGDYILYRMFYDTELQKSVVETAFKVTYENGQLICQKTEIEMYPFYQDYIENDAKTIRVYRVVDDEGNHGGIEIVYSDGRVERICENVMLDDMVNGKKADIGDVTGYTPIAFIDENRFAYNIGGWEWTKGYGIYDISTGEKTESLEGLGLQAFDEDGNLYVSKVTAYEVTNYYQITKVTEDGEKILLAAREDELVDEDVIKLEGHDNISYDYYDNYGKIYEFFEDRKPILTITTPDFKRVVFKCELDNSRGEVRYFINDDTITFVCFDNEPTYPYTDSSELTGVFKEFLAGGKEGEEGEVLKRRMIELTGWHDEETDGEAPQVYFTKWQNKALDLYLEEDHEELKLENPESYLLGSLTKKYFEYYQYSSFIPNENAKVEIVYEPYEGVYYYLCSDKTDPKKTYVYLTDDFGRTVGAHKIVPPNDIEFDSMTPVFMALGESYLSTNSCVIVYKLTSGSEEIYVTYDSEKANFPFAFIYNGKTDEDFLNANLPERKYYFETRYEFGEGHALQIELNYGKNEITKSYRAEYSYENDDVNELYMWRIAYVFGSTERKVLIASDRYPAWAIVYLVSGEVENAFPKLDEEILKLVERVETNDGQQFILYLSDGRMIYHESFNDVTLDLEKDLGIENITYAEIAHKSTIAYVIADGDKADVYTYNVISGEKEQLVEGIAWNENDPKALKFHNSKGYGTYFYDDKLYVLDLRLGSIKETDIEYANGISVEGFNEYTINVKWENLPYLTRGIAVR